jgi:ribonuclease P protein component
LLDQVHRMRSSEDFRATVRRGAKAAQPTLVTHVVLPSGSKAETVTSVGFVVNKAVGSAVSRNRVKRRLRHLMREHVSLVPPGSRIVVRALPAARVSTSSTLAGDLDVALRRSGAR